MYNKYLYIRVYIDNQGTNLKNRQFTSAKLQIHNSGRSNFINGFLVLSFVNL